MTEAESRRGKQPKYLTDRLGDKAISIIKKKSSSNQPFLLDVWFHSVHTPIEGKPELVKHFQKKVTPKMKSQNLEYAAMVASLDENVGRILKAIDEAGIADRTVVVFFSDNGGKVGKYEGKTVANNYPLRSGKGALYEGGIREPLIIRWPGVTKPGSVSDVPVSSIDYYPSILDMAGLKGNEKQNADMDGITIVPLLKNPKAKLNRTSLYWHYPHYYPTTSPVSAMRKGKWKLLHYYEDDHLELYNLDEDIEEKNNLVKQFPDTTRALYQNLKQWLNKSNAQYPSFNPQYQPKDWK